MSKRKVVRLSAQMARNISSRQLSKLLSVAIQVANDVIPFDAHVVFLSWPGDLTEDLWSFDKFVAKRSKSEFKKAQERDARVSSAPHCQYVDGHMRYLLAPINLDRDSAHIGHIAIRREARKSEGQLAQEATPFSECEIQQLEAVALLISEAIRDEQAGRLLGRLHFAFLDRRRLLQEADVQEVLNEYLLKAGHVCHELPTFGSDPAKQHSGHRYRMTAKLVDDNREKLRIGAQASTDCLEWTEERKSVVYALPASSSDLTSITAKVYLNSRTFYTNEYGADGVPIQLVFSDTRCHLSAPIMAGRGGCMGVLAVETTQERAYNEQLAAAMTLLAGHMAGPLRWALQRSEFSEIERSFTDDLWHLRSETQDDKLFEALHGSLERIYPRGVISRVDLSQNAIIGAYHWGGANMERVKNLTNRNLTSAEDCKDCQVLAVNERQPQTIQYPHQDERVKPDSLNGGELKPFTVYPIQDSHGRVVWTLHIERRDSAVLAATEDQRVQWLCKRVMKAREESRRSAFEHKWYRDMLRMSFYSFPNILTEFANCVVKDGLFARCRIFLVDAEGAQTPYWEQPFDEERSKSFYSVVIDHQDQDLDIRKESQPVLLVQKGFSSSLGKTNDSEFRVALEQVDAHVDELNNHNRSQWVEAPVKFEDQTRVKLVFDHVIDFDTQPRAELGKDDAFTLEELRLIGRLTRMLGIAAEVAEAYRIISGLCVAGIQGKLIWHFFQSATAPLFKATDLSDEANIKVDRLRNSLNAFQGVMSRFSKSRKDSGRSEAPETPPTVGEEIRAALNAIKPKCFSHTIKLPEIDPANFPQRVMQGDHSLFLALVTLLENCVKFIKKQEVETYSGEIDLGVTEVNGRTTITVSDNGVGIEADKAHELRALFKDPAKSFPWKNESGLAYLAFFAKTMGWQLSLRREQSPTTFVLTLGTQSGANS